MKNNSGKNPKIELNVAGSSVASVNLGTSKHSIKIPSVSAENSVMGIPIDNAFMVGKKPHCTWGKGGKGFMININESFTHTSKESQSGDYFYVDQNFREHAFVEYYYYLDEDKNKVYLTVDKSEITVDANGKLWYDEKEVFIETKSDIDLKMIKELADFKGLCSYEGRSDEFKEKQEKLKQYENALKQYIIVDTRNGAELDNSKDILNSTDKFDLLCSTANSSTFLLLQTQDSINMRSIIVERAKLSADMEKALEENNEVTYERLVAEYNNLGVQLDYVKSQEEYILSQLKNYYREYCKLKEEYDELYENNPVRYIVDGEIVKGYNHNGLLVLAMDKYENYAVIEYKKGHKLLYPYYISRMYDKDGNQVVFEYDKTEKLSCVTDVNGNKVNYTYDGDYLKAISYYDGRRISLEYDSDGNIVSVAEDKCKLKTELIFADGVLSTVKNYSLAASISESGATDANAQISSTTITYAFDTVDTTKIVGATIETDTEKTTLSINAEGNVAQCIKEKDGLVVDAERYEYVPYWNGTTAQSNPHKSVIKTAKSSLFVPYENFTFVDGDSETTTFNQFEKPTQTVLTSGTGTSRIVTNTTQYIYDNNQTLVEEIVTETFSNSATEIVHHKKYTYNAYGEIVRTESYVDGEIHTNGKTIEETVYDDKGNVIRSFTYNSLDPSSKFYTEYVLDEKGRTAHELDATGENKTELIYDDKGVIIGEKLPNGSTLSYGRDESGEIVAITQSNEEGVENSTKKYYTCGELTRVESGNNTIDYTYNANRKINSIKLNGQNYLSYMYYDRPIGDDFLDGMSVSNADNMVIMDEHRSKFDGKIQYLYKGSNSAEFNYDDNRKLTGVSLSLPDVDDRTLEYAYNDQEQITSYVEKENGTVISDQTIAYDNYGNVLQTTHFVSDEYQPIQCNYTYSTDSTKRLNSINFSSLTIDKKYDKLGRNSGFYAIIDMLEATETITYKKVGDHATMLPSTLKRSCRSQGVLTNAQHQEFVYDNMGNISKIFEKGELKVRYTYDNLNRLIREDNRYFNKTWGYEYDNNGNILAKKERAFTVSTTTPEFGLTYTTTKNYEYDKDRLINYNGQAITYDEMGCPTSYKGKNLTWSYGNLKSYDTTTFKYDVLGRRLFKNNTKCYYDHKGNIIRYGDLEFIYDNNGIVAMYNHADWQTYVVLKDLQGNVSEIRDHGGNVVEKYVYDAWGNHKIYGASGTEIASGMCPFRYRGYFYDVETGLYFLKSRYYDPETGRFISPDAIEYADPETINGLNLYAYCGNNPVMNVDPEGHFFWLFLIGLAIGAASGAVSYVGEVLINGIFYGKWSWSWGDFLGSIIGGAIGGALGFVSGSLGLFLGEFASNAIGMGLQNLFGEASHGLKEILSISILQGFIALGIGFIYSKIKLPKITGRGSLSQIHGQIGTKARKRMISKISAKTFGKLVIFEGYNNILPTIKNIIWSVANV